MELIRIFTSLLLIVCISTCLKFPKINEQAKEIYTTMHNSSIFGLIVQDFKGKVRVSEVIEYSPANYAGIEQGDKILEVEGEKIASVNNFYDCIEKVQNNDLINLTVYRVDSCSKFPVVINNTYHKKYP